MAVLESCSPEIHRIDKIRSRRTNLGNKGVIILKSTMVMGERTRHVRSREIGRLGITRYVSITERIHSDAQPDVNAAAAQIGRINQVGPRRSEFGHERIRGILIYRWRI